MTANLIFSSATTLWVAWILSDLAIDLEPFLPAHIVEAARDLFHEVKPFAFALIVVMHITDVWDDPHPYTFGRLLGPAINIGYWWLARKRHNDDDRWQRRRRKATETVRQVGARLVVVPDGDAA